MKRKPLTKLLSIFGLVLALVFPTLVGCGSAQTDTPTTPYPIKNFINYVTRIVTPITLDSQADIEAGFIIYNHLSDAHKNNNDVKNKKQTLDEYKATFDVLRAEQDALDAAALQESHRKRFEKAVDNLPQGDNLTVNDRAAVTAAYALYEKLNAESRNVASVKLAYSILKESDDIVTLREEQKRIEELHAQANKFADGVDSLVKDEISLESRNTIEDLLYDYEKLPDEAKAFEEVISAKEKLDDAFAEYKVLKDEKDVEKFLEQIEKLPAVNNITLNSRQAIDAAETLYDDMSEDAKAADGIADAYAKLVAARAKYDELYEADQLIKIQEFIDAANDVPTDTSNVDITWFNVLDNASSKYKELSDSSKSNPDVKEAFNRWNAAQSVFDRLGYKQVPMTNPTLVMSGDNPPFLVLQNHASMLDPLCKFFDVNSYQELDEKAVLELNVYINGEYVDTADVQFSKLSDNGHILRNTDIINALQALSAKNAKIVSGANYSFSLSVRDKNGEFIPSRKTNISPEKNTYTW